MLTLFAQYWQRLTNLVMKLTSSKLKRASWVVFLLGGSLIVSFTLLPKTDFMPRAPTDGFFYSLNMPPGGNVDFIEHEMASLVKARLAPYLSGEKIP